MQQGEVKIYLGQKAIIGKQNNHPVRSVFTCAFPTQFVTFISPTNDGDEHPYWPFMSCLPPYKGSDTGDKENIYVLSGKLLFEGHPWTSKDSKVNPGFSVSQATSRNITTCQTALSSTSQSQFGGPSLIRVPSCASVSGWKTGEIDALQCSFVPRLKGNPARHWQAWTATLFLSNPEASFVLRLSVSQWDIFGNYLPYITQYGHECM